MGGMGVVRGFDAGEAIVASVGGSTIAMAVAVAIGLTIGLCVACCAHFGSIEVGSGEL